LHVVLAKARTHFHTTSKWIPAFAGTTALAFTRSPD
jgi:hypothetical protein